MKHLQSFEDFINESKVEAVNELKTFSPANIKQYELNKSSIADLKKWSYKIKDLEIKFVEPYDYWNKNVTPDFIEFLKGNSKFTRYSSFTVNGQLFGIDIAYDDRTKPGFSASEAPYVGSQEFGIKQSEYLMFVGEAEDKIAGFIKLLDHIFKANEKAVYELYNAQLNLNTLFVIPVGEIAPTTGKTPHGWSIYEQPSSVLGILKSGGAVINAGSMKVGDKFKLVDDQKRKEIRKEAEIVALVPCNYDEYVKYCKNNGLDIPVGSFQKQTGRGRIYLYSIK